MLAELLRRATPKNTATLLSGGVDSCVLAKLSGGSCYVTGVKEKSSDVPEARKFAEAMNLELREAIIPFARVEERLREAVELVGADVVQCGIAVTIMLSCENAREHGETKIISGLGSEDLFAGYKKYKQGGDLNKQLREGFEKAKKVDLVNHEKVAAHTGIEMVYPFLDDEVVEYAFALPAEEKLRDGKDKYALRMAAEELGVPAEWAWRKKVAAQYGSGVDWAMQKLAKPGGKREYLESLC